MGICISNQQHEYNKTSIIKTNTPYIITVYESMKVVDPPNQRSNSSTCPIYQMTNTFNTPLDSLSACISPKTPILFRLNNRREMKKSTICTSNYGELIGIKRPCNVYV